MLNRRTYGGGLPTSQRKRDAPLRRGCVCVGALHEYSIEDASYTSAEGRMPSMDTEEKMPLSDYEEEVALP